MTMFIGRVVNEFLKSSFGCINVISHIHPMHYCCAFEVYIRTDAQEHHHRCTVEARDDNSLYAFGVIAQTRPKGLTNIISARKLFPTAFAQDALFIIRVYDDNVIRCHDVDHIGHSIWTWRRRFHDDHDVVGMSRAPRRVLPTACDRVISCGLRDLKTIIMREIRVIRELESDEDCESPSTPRLSANRDDEITSPFILAIDAPDRDSHRALQHQVDIDSSFLLSALPAACTMVRDMAKKEHVIHIHDHIVM